MRNLTLWMQVSLDGYTAGPDGAFDWPQVGPELNQYFVDELAGASAFLYGRNVYDMMAAFWPIADQIPDIAPVTVAYSNIWKPMPKHVFSRTIDHADWNTTIHADPVATITELKAGEGADLVFFGGADTAHTLITHDLIDDYRLNIHPVILGGGTPLFPPGTNRTQLQHISTHIFDATIPHVHYRRPAD